MGVASPLLSRFRDCRGMPSSLLLMRCTCIQVDLASDTAGDSVTTSNCMARDSGMRWLLVKEVYEARTMVKFSPTLKLNAHFMQREEELLQGPGLARVWTSLLLKIEGTIRRTSTSVLIRISVAVPFTLVLSTALCSHFGVAVQILTY